MGKGGRREIVRHRRWENVQISHVRWQSVLWWSVRSESIVAMRHSDRERRKTRCFYSFYTTEAFIWRTTNERKGSVTIQIRCDSGAGNWAHAVSTFERWKPKPQRNFWGRYFSLLVEGFVDRGDK